MNCSGFPARKNESDWHVLLIFFIQVCIATVGLIENLWILRVSYGKKYIEGAYKIPFAGLAFSNVMYCISLISNVVTSREVSENLFETMVADYPGLCRLQIAFTLCAIIGVIGSLLAAPLQRYMIFGNSTMKRYALNNTFNAIFTTAMIAFAWALCTGRFHIVLFILYYIKKLLKSGGFYFLRPYGMLL